MRFSILLLVITTTVTIIGCLFINLFSRPTAEDKKKTNELLEKFVAGFCFENAMKIDKASSNMNSPLRPTGESYLDGIISVGRKNQGKPLPEHSLLHIQKVEFVSMSSEVDHE